MRTVSFDELVSADYQDLALLATIFNHEAIEDDHGVWRWKKNDLMRLFEESFPAFVYENGFPGVTSHLRVHLDLNRLRLDLLAEKFSLEEYVKFHMQIGYSLEFFEIFGWREATEFGVAESLESETVIEYLLRVHKDEVLKI